LKEKVKPLITKATAPIEEIAAKYGHKIIWLPPYHPEFNPI